jgi:hypothetical protein
MTPTCSSAAQETSSVLFWVGGFRPFAVEQCSVARMQTIANDSPSRAHERAWLDVPFGEKDRAKACGARWDPEARRWYASRTGIPALARWAALPPLPDPLPGEDRTFGSGLFVDLVPSTCWFTNVRTCVVPRDWQRLRYPRRIGRRTRSATPAGAPAPPGPRAELPPGEQLPAASRDHDEMSPLARVAGQRSPDAHPPDMLPWALLVVAQNVLHHEPGAAGVMDFRR